MAKRKTKPKQRKQKPRRRQAKKRNSQQVPETPNIDIVLRQLPLFDDLYLGMQAMNLAIVDGFLEDAEASLLREYMEIERTPLMSAILVSALSQLWIFGLYELLRTWRQRARNVLKFAEDLQSISGPERQEFIERKRNEVASGSSWQEGAVFNWPPFEKAASDSEYVETVRKAVDRTERLFRRIEALRVSLAKHEVPKSRGVAATAPGYGRIDMRDGSIYWQIVLRGNEVDLVSRRTIADMCRELAHDRSLAILSPAIQAKIARLPEFSYGIKRVTVVLNDGKEYAGVYVAWSKEIVAVHGNEGIPFDVDKVIDVREDPAAENDIGGGGAGPQC